MPTALCNTCQEFVRWPYSRKYKKQVCACGSSDLTQVSGHMAETEEGTVWEYRDRKGQIRKTVVIEMEAIKQ